MNLLAILLVPKVQGGGMPCALHQLRTYVIYKETVLKMVTISFSALPHPLEKSHLQIPIVLESKSMLWSNSSKAILLSFPDNWLQGVPDCIAQRVKLRGLDVQSPSDTRSDEDGKIFGDTILFILGIKGLGTINKS